MSVAIQLDLFENLDDIGLLRKEFEEVRAEAGRVRRGIFSRHNDLSKLYLKMDERFERVEWRINAIERTLSNHSGRISQ